MPTDFNRFDFGRHGFQSVVGMEHLPGYANGGDHKGTQTVATTRVRPYNSLQMGMRDVMLKMVTIQTSHKQNTAEWKTEEHDYRKAINHDGRTKN